MHLHVALTKGEALGTPEVSSPLSRSLNTECVSRHFDTSQFPVRIGLKKSILK